MSQPAAGEYVRPVGDTNPQYCKNCKHAVFEHHVDFTSNKIMACFHVEKEIRCNCEGYFT